MQKKKAGERKEKRRKKKEIKHMIGVGVCVKVGGAMGSYEIIIKCEKNII